MNTDRTTSVCHRHCAQVAEWPLVECYCGVLCGVLKTRSVKKMNDRGKTARQKDSSSGALRPTRNTVESGKDIAAQNGPSETGSLGQLDEQITDLTHLLGDVKDRLSKLETAAA